MIISKFRSAYRSAMTLIETSIVLIVAIGAMAAGANIYSDHLENRVNQAAAQELSKVSNAFGRYLKDNYGLAMQKAVDDGGITEIPVSDLTTGG